MAQTYATEISGQSSVPTTMANGAVVGGRLRRFRATVTLASQAADDTIVLAKLPAGFAFAYGIINASATLGSSTVAIGTAASAGKYRAAATFTAAAPTLFGAVAAVDDAPLTAEETVIATIAAAALPSSGTMVVDIYASAP
jgi:hypothetical protein